MKRSDQALPTANHPACQSSHWHIQHLCCLGIGKTIDNHEGYCQPLILGQVMDRIARGQGIKPQRLICLSQVGDMDCRLVSRADNALPSVSGSALVNEDPLHDGERPTVQPRPGPPCVPTGQCALDCLLNEILSIGI